MPLDSYGRDIHYLRISLIDKCNMRCVYCMPEDMIFRPSDELMTCAEILRLVRLFAELGIDKIRLTGGEPTVYPDLIPIVRGIREQGIWRISMTTNGLRLAKLARPLKEAGLERVNVSVDTLDAEKFRRITRWGKLADVMAGVYAAEAAGLTPGAPRRPEPGFRASPSPTPRSGRPRSSRGRTRTSRRPGGRRSPRPP